ncbi:MAG: beta-lactamase family protein [Candidatus Eremiobacteraeota bacterium]|nr:beta-lactamase family protein [Candidatus Eremiobacteraeota bacterium]
MKHRLLCAYALLTTFAIAPNAVFAAPSTLDASERTRVDALFNDDNSHTPGCALGVFRDGTIAYARGYGMADLEHGVPITPASVFDVGSISKQFAAAAITLLVEQHKLSFTDDVRKYIPELPDYGAPITINELTWHTSGLRDYTSLLDLAGYGLEQAATDDDALKIQTRQRGLDFPSGTQYEYSNTNYFLLSVIVKRVSGQTLAQFVRKYIFLPLGMTHTLYRDDFAMLIPNRAMGYAPAGKGIFKNSMSNWQQTGDGAVQISINDALKWDGNFYNPRVGGPEMLQQLQTPGRLSDGRPLTYGRGLFIENYRGLKLISHGGAWIGYRGQIDRYPSVHTSVVVFCNSDASMPGSMARKVADVVLARYLKPVQNRAGAKSTVSATSVAGSYFNETTGDVLNVVARRGKVGLDFSGSFYALEPAGPTSFALGTSILHFVVRQKGGVASELRMQGSDGMTGVAHRFTRVTPTAEQLDGVTGSYYSRELDVTWKLRADGNTVRIEPTRNLASGAAGKLQPQMADTFTSDRGFTIRFTRDTSHRITGFTLSAGRGLRSLTFTRV